MRLKAANSSESPSTLLEQLKRIHQQTVRKRSTNPRLVNQI
jgi:hypothetical protein